MKIVVVSAVAHVPEEEAAGRFCESWWRWALPGCFTATVYRSDNAASARNASVHLASRLGADVVVVVDAGVLFAPVTEVLDAVQGAAQSGALHVLSSTVRRLDEGETSDLVAGVGVPVDGETVSMACGLVTTADTYWRCGGADERLPSGGGEELIAAAETLAKVHYHGATAFSLWPGSPEVPVDESLLSARYATARGNKFAIQQLADERPLSDGQGALWPPWAL